MGGVVLGVYVNFDIFRVLACFFQLDTKLSGSPNAGAPNAGANKLWGGNESDSDDDPDEQEVHRTKDMRMNKENSITATSFKKTDEWHTVESKKRNGKESKKRF